MPCLQFDSARRILCGGALALALFAGIGSANAPSAWAQRAQPAEPAAHAESSGDSGASSRAARPRAQRQLPADTTTDQSVELGGRTLRFKATAGSIPLNNAEDG